jgi:hypothetical protein
MGWEMDLLLEWAYSVNHCILFFPVGVFAPILLLLDISAKHTK